MREATNMTGTAAATEPQERERAATRFAVRFIEVYRAQVSPRLGTTCRFEPSCSEYALQAYRKFGFFKATRRTLGRLSRCRDGYKGPRYDPPV